MRRSGEAPLAKVSTVTRVGVRGWTENRVQRSREKRSFPSLPETILPARQLLVRELKVGGKKRRFFFRRLHEAACPLHYFPY